MGKLPCHHQWNRNRFERWEDSISDIRKQGDQKTDAAAVSVFYFAEGGPRLSTRFGQPFRQSSSDNVVSCWTCGVSCNTQDGHSR